VNNHLSPQLTEQKRTYRITADIIASIAASPTGQAVIMYASQARTGISNVICYVIGKFDIFPSMCGSDKVLITELTLIHKNIRSFRNSHVQELTDIENIGQCDLKHILTRGQ
jgi:hypothetical protein